MTTEKNSNPQLDAQVLILGGGIGGLTLGAHLRRLNISYKILERAPQITPAGAGISLAPNCLKTLDQDLGIYGEIQEKGQALRKIQIHRNRTKWRTLSFEDCQRWFGYPVYSVDRHALHHMLLEKAGGEESENVVLNAKVEDVVDDEEESTCVVKTADGRVFRSLMVVGADGIRSATRRCLARNAGMEAKNTIKFTGRVHMSGYTEPIPGLDEEDLGVANWLFYDNAILTTWPCKDNRQWYIGVKQAEKPVGNDRSVWQGTTNDTINDEYGDYFHPFGQTRHVKDIVDHTERIIASNVFQEGTFPSMSAGRVALLGDAAHSMTSFFGQGACQAIEDATVLARVLHEHFNTLKPEKPESREAIRDALTTYCEIREPRARDLVSFSANYAKVHTANLPYGLGPMVRKLIYAWLPAWGWMYFLRWLYEMQPTVGA